MNQSIGWLTSPSAEELRSAIVELMPELGGRSLVLMDRVVTDNPQFFQGRAILDNAYIVKFAWSEPPARRLVHEGRILAVLAETHPGLAVPRLVATSSSPAFLVTRLVSGEPLSWEAANDLAGERRERLVWDLAGFLATLHDPATLNAARDVGVPLETWEPQATTDELRLRFGRLIEPAQRPTVDRWCDWVDEILAGPATPTLVHGDLHGYNLVWTPDSGALQLVADFETAGEADPAFDFRYLPGQAETPDLFLEIAHSYEELTGRAVDLRRAMAWHIRTVLGDALWRTEAGVPLPGGGGTASSWVDELRVRMAAVLEP